MSNCLVLIIEFSKKSKRRTIIFKVIFYFQFKYLKNLKLHKKFQKLLKPCFNKNHFIKQGFYFLLRWRNTAKLILKGRTRCEKKC